MSERSALEERPPIARHGRRRSPGPGRQLLTFFSTALAVILVSVIGVGGWALLDLNFTLSAGAVTLEGDPPPDFGELKGGATIFVAGTDKCEESFAHFFPGRCKDKDDDPERNDVNMLVHISDAPRRVTVLNIPRDTMVRIPECTDAHGNPTSPRAKTMLNETIPIGGLPCAVKTVSEMTGLKIDYAASINWGGVIEITNAIGGVDVCVADRIYDPKHTGLDLAPGMHTLKGYDALQFLRVRKGVGDGSDLGRISNQQQYLSRLVQKVMSEQVLTNPGLLFKLARTGLANITPSTSLTNPSTLVQMALALKDVPPSDYVFMQYPVLDDPDNSNRVVPDEATVATLVDALKENKKIELSGSAGRGVTEDPNAEPSQDPSETPGGGETPGTGETPGSGESGTPGTDNNNEGETVVTLPSSVTGTTAAKATCSAQWRR